MRGQQPLIAMRLKRRSPLYGVEIETTDQASRWVSMWSTKPHEHGKAHVHIEPNDVVANLDLRFVISLHVCIDGTSKDRVMEVFEACKRAGAARVIATVFRIAGESCPTVEILDTEGTISWQTF